ncbi:aldolase catalytic domain-containing protein [Croceicoccus sp. F390]|uniref:Aldolase catalytic domain-containing protein n=1 Tax=Croceicoccus esteveae TaxID=3075597 RepID=A0ABU2ZGK4_9SPHN|nr:aldolase catalytic domain-containing protein [Croceicoccus sp. F390]MDT0575726.1 aldolase catalytic domain-containing protein [Croceicoccus sp. F390]
MPDLTILDCTLRDGGYYNDWDFDPELIAAYLDAMHAAKVDVVELGQRFLGNAGFKGPCAYTTDEFLATLNLHGDLRIAVMVNGADLLHGSDVSAALAQLFPQTRSCSAVDLVRIACHVHEVEDVLPASLWLQDAGFKTGINLMQIADRSRDEVVQIARQVARHPVDVLYFADSMGSMTPDHTARVVGWLREAWHGPIGIHTHDNMGLALQNSLRALDAGASWVDATVTGMGRGPGNARTEELVIELNDREERGADLVPLLSLIRRHLQPMKARYGWGTNPFYYLSGKYGIHPSYVQEMAADSRFDEEDFLAVIEDLRARGAKKYSATSLAAARNFFRGEPGGSWHPADLMAGREVMIIGSGPGVVRHRDAISSYIRRKEPVVLALNTQSPVAEDLVTLRVASHPVRLLADAAQHCHLPQPLVTPASMLPPRLHEAFAGKDLLDFGVAIEDGRFAFGDTCCTIPNALVISYALAVAGSGGAQRILLAGFDGYQSGDRRNAEMDATLDLFCASGEAPPVHAVTPTTYRGVEAMSIYGM